MKTPTAISTLLLTAVAAAGCANRGAVEVEKRGAVAIVDPEPTFERDAPFFRRASSPPVDSDDEALLVVA